MKGGIYVISSPWLGVGPLHSPPSRSPFPSIRLHGSFVDLGRTVSNTTGCSRLRPESRVPCDWSSLECGVAWRGVERWSRYQRAGSGWGCSCSQPGEPMSWTDEIVLRPAPDTGAPPRPSQAMFYQVHADAEYRVHWLKQTDKIE